MAAPQKSGPKNETQIIYSMMGVTKEIDRKKILNNVSISYYYDESATWSRWQQTWSREGTGDTKLSSMHIHQRKRIP